ncbi:MAG: hypothetical protein QXJ28_00435 [Candidatus Pacearchaeota archaeon]
MKNWKAIRNESNYLVLIIILFSLIFQVSAGVIVSDTDETEFITAGAKICILKEGNTFWKIGNVETPSFNDCYRTGGVSEGGNPQEKCCPSGFICNGEQEGNSRCVASRQVAKCSDFTTENECKNYMINYGQLPESIKRHIEYGVANIRNERGEVVEFCHMEKGYYRNDNPCFIIGYCGCDWIDNTCKEVFVNTSCDNPSPTSNNVIKCITETKELENKCGETENIIRVEWKGRLVDSNNRPISATAPWCKDGSKIIQCPVRTSLPFFGLFEMIIAITIIGLFYLIEVRRKGCKK